MKNPFSTILVCCALGVISGCVDPQTGRAPDADESPSLTTQSVPTPAPTPAPVSQKTISYGHVVDLSHVIATNIPLWPGDPAVEFQTVASIDTDGYFLRKFTIGEHSATHMNAPASFMAGGATIDAYPQSSLVVPAVVIDVRCETEKNPDYQFSKQDLLKWESVHGQVPAGSLVLLYTGWQEKWNNPVAFFNQDASGGLHFPGFGSAVTKFLLQHRHIAGVGIDTHGADPGQDTTYATNNQVLANGGIVLECVNNLDKIPATGSTLVLGMLRLKGGSGTPLSITALAP
jgi:kynurenine formamidase